MHSCIYIAKIHTAERNLDTEHLQPESQLAVTQVLSIGKQWAEQWSLYSPNPFMALRRTLASFSASNPL